MEHLEFSIVLEHTTYSLISATAAVILSLGLGWLLAMLTFHFRRQKGKLSSVASMFPVRATVFSLAGTIYLSHYGMMKYMVHFGPTANWVFVASTTAMTCFGSWVVATYLIRKWLPDAISDRSLIPLIHSLFVMAPWLCLRPGRMVGGGGLGSTEIRATTQLDFEALNWAILAISLIALTIDLCFGAGRICANWLVSRHRAVKSEQVD